MQHKIENDAETKIEVSGLTKIFGKRINRAKEMLKQGKTKAEILKATGATVGVDQADFTIKKVKSSLSWGFLVRVNQPHCEC